MMKNLKLNTLDLMNVEALNSEGLLLTNGGEVLGKIRYQSVTGNFDASGARVAKEYKDSSIEFDTSQQVAAVLEKLVALWMTSHKS